jgi:predicted transport protein
MKSAIFMNGKKFDETKFNLEETFEKIVIDNSKTLFGSKTIYFDIKSRIGSKTLGSSIPDGFLFDFKDEENPEFYLVEVELESHDFYKHMFPQITKFFAFFKNSASRNNLIEKLFYFIKGNEEIKKEFKQYLREREIYKALKDIIENSQNILLILDESKPELPEVFETYTDTWDKMVKVEILKQYTTEGLTIFTMNPDFEDIELVKLPTSETEEEEEKRYTENYHLEEVDPTIINAYEEIKAAMLNIDSSIKINPQKYYISLRQKKNFAYIDFSKRKMNIVIILPFDYGNSAIKKHKVKQLSQGVQDFYGYPCFKITLENDEDLEEIFDVLEEAYEQQANL